MGCPFITVHMGCLVEVEQIRNHLTTFYNQLHERVFENPAVIQLVNKFLLWNPKRIAVCRKLYLLGYYLEPDEGN
jgi:hypothetical protein